MNQTNKPSDKELKIETEIARFAITEFVKKLREWCEEHKMRYRSEHEPRPKWMGELYLIEVTDILDYAESIAPKEEKIEALEKGNK